MPGDNLKEFHSGALGSSMATNSLSEQFREYSISAVRAGGLHLHQCEQREKRRKNAKQCNLVLPN